MSLERTKTLQKLSHIELEKTKISDDRLVKIPKSEEEKKQQQGKRTFKTMCQFK